MKRSLTLLISLLLLVSLLIPTVSAKEPQEVIDSANISTTVLNKLDIPEDATTLRIFSVVLSDNISQFILDLLSDKGSHACYIASSENGEDYTVWHKGTASPIYTSDELELDPVAMQFYLNADLTQHLGNEVTVDNVFYLQGSWNDTAIFYRTSIGDYVYYHNQNIEPCLFSYEAFSAYMHFLKELAQTDDASRRNITLALSPWKLSAYTIGSPGFDPDANDFPLLPYSAGFMLCTIVILLIAAVVLVLVIVYKKKYKSGNPCEENKGTTLDPDFVIAHTINDYVYDPEDLPGNAR